jgi:hypothetical protein
VKKRYQKYIFEYKKEGKSGNGNPIKKGRVGMGIPSREEWE